MAINKIMVLGAGTMGMGIAQVFAEAGKTVIVRDIAEEFIQRGEGVLKKNMEKKVSKGKISEADKDAVLSRVSYSLELAAAAAGADGLIIEVHNDPAHALCDGPQSLTPEAFDGLMKKVEAIRPYADR